ncbi:MAG: hypothetical protein WD249_06415 [Gaiellaceae bacterium]
MEGRFLRLAGILAGAVSAAVLLSVGAQSGQATLPEAPSWLGLPLTLGMDVQSLHDSDSTHEELPGLGHKFELLGVAMDDQAPDNPTNDTISMVTTPATIGIAFWDMPPGFHISALDGQLGFKYFFVNRSCGGGSPRLTLLVDANGDGTFDQSSGDFAAHGHPNPFVACPANTWVYENLTDNGPHWEVTPGGAVEGIPVFPFSTWDTLEAAVTAQFPNHKVLAGFIVDDSCSFHLPACGEAHYDLVTIENRTLEQDQDTVRR